MKITTLLFALMASLTLRGQSELSQPFRDCQLEGSITLYDYNEKKWTTNDSIDSQRGTLPASTFKIINTLIALETGALADENEVLKWPGQTDTSKYGYRPDTYHDMNVKEAFQKSVVWFYLALAEKIGREKYKTYLSQSHYGNADVSYQDPDFWNFGNLAISPANQIEILRGIYEETLPFSQRSFAILKDLMIEEQTETYTLRAKTGWTRHNGQDIGWWVGYVEKENNVYFFATRVKKDRNIFNPDFAQCRKEITRTILKDLKIIE